MQILNRLIASFFVIRISWKRLSALLLLLVLSACAIGRTAASTSSTDRQIEGTLWINRQSFRQGEQVEIRFTLHNISEDMVVLERTGDPLLDIAIETNDRTREWSSSVEGRPIHSLQLKPGEMFEVLWTVPELPDGAYVVSGYWWSYGASEVSISMGITYGPTGR